MGVRTRVAVVGPGGATTLLGRDAEMVALRGVLDRAGSGRAAAAVVQGEAGIGKTALLDALAAVAGGEDWRCIAVRGVEAESVLPFAGLFAVAQPLRGYAPVVPPAQAAALDAALGWRSGGGGDRFLVGAATLSLLAGAAADRPTLVVVDDVQWVDRESAEALLFAARRLGHDRVAVVATYRVGLPLPTSLDGLDVVDVAGLPATIAGQLLGPGLADGVLERLTAETGGNPLALRECGRVLTAAQRAGAATLPVALPVPGRLREAYARELGALPADGWRAVVLCAASSDESAAPVIAALGGAGLEPAASLAAAADVVTLDGGILTFRHPLLRSAALHRATPDERRDAHRALADAVGDRDARVWHRAEATVGYDEDLARELAELADRDRSRRGYAAAAVAVERAVRLTADRSRRIRWLAGAVDDAYLAGDGDRVRRLAAEVLDATRGATDPRSQEGRSRVLSCMGVLELYGGTYTRAAELLEEAAAVATGRLLLRTLSDLSLIYYNVDDRVRLTDLARRAAAGADPADAEQAMLAAYLSGAAQVWAGRPDLGEPLVRRAIELLESDPDLRDDPRQIAVAFFAALWLMDPTVALPYGDRRLARAREVGALGMLAVGLTLAAGGLAWLGDHVRAYAFAGEAVELLSALGRTTEPGIAHEILAVESAGRGLHDDAGRMLERARKVVAATGIQGTPPHLADNIAYCALCRGDLIEVVAVLEEQIERHGGVSLDLVPLGVAPHLVEAYLGLGRDADARALTARFMAAQPETPYEHVAAMIERCRALIAADIDEAAAHFDRALAHHADSPNRHEGARTRLLYGMRLRRAGRRIAAREHLYAARREFVAMDLTLWAQRAADELAGTGERARRRDGGTQPLTSQETRVAVLVAQGMTNREVAAALFLSPKTVEHHLGAVLRKRGLRSRTELARAIAGEPPGD
jgi:DNA-binding NarL/FixJ family response regulator